MTEDYWLTCSSPDPLLQYLKDKVSDRKLRLYACYCAREVWHWLDDVRKRFVESFESSLLGLPPRPDKRQASPPGRYDFDTMDRYSGPYIACTAVGQIQGGGAWAAAWNVGGEIRRALGSTCGDARHAVVQRHAALIRELFANPFRSGILDAIWRTPTVKQLADAIYAHEDFDGLPILSDALEEAGCDNVEILTHFRHPGLHMRGCWALDLVLDKE